MRKAIASMLLASVLAGCATGSAVIVGKVRPAITEQDVKVYLQPPEKYEQIAIVEATSRDSMAMTDQGKLDVVISRMKQEAAKIGANGIILNSTGEQTGAAVVPSYSSGSYGMGMAVPTRHKTGSAVAIYVP